MEEGRRRERREKGRRGGGEDEGKEKMGREGVGGKEREKAHKKEYGRRKRKKGVAGDGMLGGRGRTPPTPPLLVQSPLPPLKGPV